MPKKQWHELKILQMTLKKQWFDQIEAGLKKIEYRDKKPYWACRLFHPDGRPKRFDQVKFRNGYSPASPVMRVEFKGVTTTDKFYEIHLGRVVSVTR